MSAVVALVLYVGWLATAFGLRTVRHLRRTGDTGLRATGLAAGSVQWWARLLFVAAIAAGIAAPIAELLGLRPILALDHTGVRVAGAAAAVAGMAATVAAQLAMGDSWRVGVNETEHTALVTTGPFRIVRNPIFTTMVATATGLAMLVPNIVSVAGLAALVFAVQTQVRLVEEPYLDRTHPDRYAAYASAVGRFIPRMPGRAVR